SPTSCPHAWTINIFKLSQWTPQAGSGVSALKPNRKRTERSRPFGPRVHVQSGGHGPRGEIQSFRVFPSTNHPGPSACNEASPPRDPQARVWASSGGNGPLGAIYNPTRARSAALLCQPEALRADADSSPIVEEFTEACVAFRGKTKDG
ncbi:Cryptic plasmid protein C, partial [Dissostichus eleginoides]